MPEKKTCEAKQYSDQMYCGKCGFTWDMNDPDPPKCLSSKQIGERALSEIKADILAIEKETENLLNTIVG